MALKSKLKFVKIKRLSTHLKVWCLCAPLMSIVQSKLLQKTLNILKNRTIKSSILTLISRYGVTTRLNYRYVYSVYGLQISSLLFDLFLAWSYGFSSFFVKVKLEINCLCFLVTSGSCGRRCSKVMAGFKKNTFWEEMLETYANYLVFQT